jgi:hypothetical protein
MAVVMSNVDDKLVAGNNVNVEVEEPKVEVEIKADEPKNEETKVSDDMPYGVPEVESKAEAAAAPNKDEFGNEVSRGEIEEPKGRTYSEEEVNRIVRDRLKRTEEGKKQEVQPEQNEENWEQEFENKVEETLYKVSQREQAKIREQKEREALGRLESNIHQSMARYKDFKQVVDKAHISDTMVKATKGFKDPGAFLYAASKMQGKELERISRLDDPIDQAAEIGKLEERMRKLKGASQSPRPMSDIKGDITNRENVRPSVDDLIRKDQIKKFQRRY